MIGSSRDAKPLIPSPFSRLLLLLSQPLHDQGKSTKMKYFTSATIFSVLASTVVASPQIHMKGSKVSYSSDGMSIKDEFSRDLFFSTTRDGMVGLGSVERHRLSFRQGSQWIPVAEVSKADIPTELQSSSSQSELEFPLEGGARLLLKAQPCDMHQDHLMFLAAIVDGNGRAIPVAMGALPKNLATLEVNQLTKRINRLLKHRLSTGSDMVQGSSATFTAAAASEPARVPVAAVTAAATSAKDGKETTKEEEQGIIDFDYLAEHHPVLFGFLIAFGAISTLVLLVAFPMLVRRFIRLIQARDLPPAYHAVPATDIDVESGSSSSKFIKQ